MQLDFKLDNMQVGMGTLFTGYIDYAKSVIIYRALPDLRDGLKPVNRCTLYTAYNMRKRSGTVKCAKIASDVTANYHPHGDASVYEALVLLTTGNGAMSIPLLYGDSNFGRVTSSERHAASRYTEARISEDALKYYCEEMNGIRMIPNFDSTTTMPELFPVKFPAVLCNSQEGVAVGFRGKMPSFNVIDVLNLVKEYIKDGECHTVIMPDFVTGGYYIQNNKELAKLMTIGTAKLKLRGRVEVMDKNILITEFPYGKTAGMLKKQIEDAEISGVRSVNDASEKGVDRVLIECTGKNRVDEVLYALYKKTDLQCTFSADLTCILDSAPVTLGVFGIVGEWVKWRRTVLERSLKDSLQGAKDRARASRAFVELMSKRDKMEEFCNLVIKKSKEEAIQFVLDNYDNSIIDYDLAVWLISRRLSDFRRGERYVEEYERCKATIDALENDLQDIDGVILRQCDEMIEDKKVSHVRRTEISNKDYNFVKSEEEQMVYVDNTTCYYMIKDNFIRKYRFESQIPKGTGYLEASASATLLGIDNRGRVIRLYCKDIPYTANNEVGTYIPKYLGLEESDDYEVLYLDELDGKKKVVVYDDGFVGFLDTYEWLNSKKQMRVVERGINGMYAKNVAGVYDYEPSGYLYVIDTAGRISYVLLDTIKQMDRTARKKVFELKKNTKIKSLAVVDGITGYNMLNNVGSYCGPTLRYLASANDFLGDASLFQASYTAI